MYLTVMVHHAASVADVGRRLCRHRHDHHHHHHYHRYHSGSTM